MSDSTFLYKSEKSVFRKWYRYLTQVRSLVHVCHKNVPILNWKGKLSNALLDIRAADAWIKFICILTINRSIWFICLILLWWKNLRRADVNKNIPWTIGVLSNLYFWSSVCMGFVTFSSEMRTQHKKYRLQGIVSSNYT